MTTKQCPRCGETKAVDGFGRDRGKRDGLAYCCKECTKVRNAAYYAANDDKVKAATAAYRAANPDRVKAANAAKRAGGRDPGRPWPEGPIRYETAHKRVEAIYGRAKSYACQHCDGPATEWAYDYGDPDEYSEPRFDARRGSNRIMRWSGKPQHYMPLCHPCHTRFDRKKESAA